MHDAKIDIAVLLIFFNRPEKIQQVFDAVRAARPSRLYLYQDGAREGREDDVENVKKCREIFENIDWDCEVHTKFQEKNFGCDPSGFIAQKWLFENEEMGIVLEDDVVPAPDFFPFCKELLEYYKDDPRVNIICGMNNIEVAKHIEDSYLFTKKGSIWGWASWKRVLDTWDGAYTWLDDPAALETIRSQMDPQEYETFVALARQRRESGKEYHETVNAAAMYLNRSMNIVPKYNLTYNVGVGGESTHGSSEWNMVPSRTRKLFYMKTYDITFPLTHPKEMVRDTYFEKKMTLTAWDKFTIKVELAFRTLRYQGLSTVLQKIGKKVKGNHGK